MHRAVPLTCLHIRLLVAVTVYLPSLPNSAVNPKPAGLQLSQYQISNPKTLMARLYRRREEMNETSHPISKLPRPLPLPKSHTQIQYSTSNTQPPTSHGHLPPSPPPHLRPLCHHPPALQRSAHYSKHPVSLPPELWYGIVQHTRARRRVCIQCLTPRTPSLPHTARAENYASSPYSSYHHPVQQSHINNPIPVTHDLPHPNHDLLTPIQPPPII